MKHLSFILALMVLILSTAPCFTEDKCLETAQQTTDNQEQDDDNCGMACCSPFSKCNTCTGFVITSFYVSIIDSLQLPVKKLGAIPAPSVSDFPYSIWHPPQLA